MTDIKTLFINHPDDYKRDFDFMGAYLVDQATGLSKVTGKSYEYCLDYVKRETGPGGHFEIRDPAVEYIGKNQFEDREIRVTTLTNYIANIVNNEFIMAPTFTVYKNKKQEVAFPTIYIQDNVSNRSKHKKEAFAFKEAKDLDGFAFKWNEQNVDKVLNNGLSGAQCSPSTILFCHTLHSTLTSVCRTASGNGNSNNERIVCGNRHYWSPDIVEANILAHVRLCDRSKWQEAITKYNIHLPTPAETMAVVEYSTKLYYNDVERNKDIYRLIKSISPLERAMFCYSADFYHLAKFNRDLVYSILDKLSTQEPTPVPQNTKPSDHLNSFNDDQLALVSLSAGALMAGSSIYTIDSATKETQELVMGSITSIKEGLVDYSDILRLIFVPNIMPPTIAHLPSIVRRIGVLSDTDSTVFTVQEWIEWFWGKISFDPKPVRVGHVVAYLASASITHVLATMSANMGVAKEELFKYAMKSEYYFPVFALTSRAKTYFALRGAQEGLVFIEPELESKGAVLKASNLSEELRLESRNMILRILNKIAQGEMLNLREEIDFIANIERGVISDLRAGSTKLFKSIDMKEAESYRLPPHQSNYMHHTLWETVFAPKYGTAGTPPYVSVRITTSLDKPKALREWLANIEDRPLAMRLTNYLAQIDRKVLGSMLIPTAILTSAGLPIEIADAVDVRGVVSQIMEPFYVVLECLGMYFLEGNQQRLLTDYY